jgi:RNA polymerase sigma-54 factor
MELRPQQFHQQKQSLSITGQVIQSIRLLQLGNHELEDFLREQADDNPLLTVVVGPSHVQKPDSSACTRAGHRVCCRMSRLTCPVRANTWRRAYPCATISSRRSR